MPIKKIASRLGVSSSSVSYWVRGIPISNKHKRRNHEAHQGSEAQRRRSEKWSEMCRELRRVAQAEGRERAREGDQLHSAGCMLYWAEGAKSKNQVCLANSDIHMVRYFLQFLRSTFAVSNDRITVRVNVYLGNGWSIDDVEKYWLDALELPSTCLRKPQINHFPTSSSGTRVNKLPYGVCTLRVSRSTPLLQHIFGAIQEYGGFEEPAWLG